MSDNNQPPESGYGQFYKEDNGLPSSAASQPMSARPLGETAFKKKTRSPIVVTGVFLLVGVAFAALIIGAYPDTKDEKGSVPIVQASAERFKVTPDNRGGKKITYRDSTIFDTVRGNPMSENSPMENLLEQDEAAVEKIVALEAQAAQEVRDAKRQSSIDMASATVVPMENLLEPISRNQGTVEKAVMQKIAVVKPAPAVKPVVQKTPPRTLHAPGGSPETLAFVRSVLDKKDAKFMSVDSAISAAAVQPAAGDASVDMGFDFFVQLGSIRSVDGAAGEWTRLKKAFSGDLNNAEYRIKSADLGERGTFYRIQAGPYTKTYATSLCDSIKMQKPGACLVVR